MQMRLSIWPRLEAAAVCTSALWPSRRMVSTMPSAVSGLTKHEAPSAGVAPAGSTRHCSALMVRYCEYIAPPSMATVLPSSACAAGEAPAATTTPAPSLPTGIDWSEPAGHAPSCARSGTCAVTTGRRGAARWTLAVSHVGGAEQQAEVGGIDRRGLDAHQHFVGRRRGTAPGQRQLQLAAGLDERAQLQRRARCCMLMVCSFLMTARDWEPSIATTCAWIVDPSEVIERAVGRSTSAILLRVTPDT